MQWWKASFFVKNKPTAIVVQETTTELEEEEQNTFSFNIFIKTSSYLFL